MLSRPPSSPAIAILKPWPSGADAGSRPARGSSRTSPSRSAAISSRASSPARQSESPGVPFSTTMHEMPRGPALAGAHHADVDVGDAAARDEGLGAVEHVVVAVARRARLQARGVRARSPARSGNSSRNAPWCRASAGSGARCAVAAERVDHPGRHVVDRDVGRGRGAALRQLLEDDGGVEPRQRRAADIVLARRCRRSRAPPPGAASRPGRSRSRPSRAHAASSRRARTARAVSWMARCSSESSKSMPSASVTRPMALRPWAVASPAGEPAYMERRARPEDFGRSPWPSNTAARSKARAAPVEADGPGRRRSTSPPACGATASPNGRGAWCARTCSPPTT